MQNYDFLKRFFGKKYFGFVTNLCKFDEPGTHWTSSFFILDPELDSYGAYYYDSVGRKIPPLLKPVFIDIQKQMNMFQKLTKIIYLIMRQL